MQLLLVGGRRCRRLEPAGRGLQGQPHLPHHEPGRVGGRADASSSSAFAFQLDPLPRELEGVLRADQEAGRGRQHRPRDQAVRRERLPDPAAREGGAHPRQQGRRRDRRGAQREAVASSSPRSRSASARCGRSRTSRRSSASSAPSAASSRRSAPIAAPGLSQADKQRMLSNGIAEAMYNTAFGLGIAVFCMIAHVILHTRAEEHPARSGVDDGARLQPAHDPAAARASTERSMAEPPWTLAQRSAARQDPAARAAARAGPDEEGGELNIVPFLDIIMNILMFVLATIAVTFTATHRDHAARPAAAAGVRAERRARRSTSTVLIVNEGFSLKASGGNIAPGCDGRRARHRRCRRRAASTTTTTLTACATQAEERLRRVQGRDPGAPSPPTRASSTRSSST